MKEKTIRAPSSDIRFLRFDPAIMLIGEALGDDDGGPIGGGVEYVAVVAVEDGDAGLLGVKNNGEGGMDLSGMMQEAASHPLLSRRAAHGQDQRITACSVDDRPCLLPIARIKVSEPFCTTPPTNLIARRRLVTSTVRCSQRGRRRRDHKPQHLTFFSLHFCFMSVL